MANKQRIEGPHNKIMPTTVGLPAWYRPLLLAISPRSSSQGLRALVDYALQNGAAQHLLGVADDVRDLESIAQLVIGCRTPVQQPPAPIEPQALCRLTGKPLDQLTKEEHRQLRLHLLGLAISDEDLYRLGQQLIARQEVSL